MKSCLTRNVAWAKERTEADPDYFKRLSAIQRPEYLWIGCADSRVPANVITGLAPGEVFVHRNVANLIHPGDLNALVGAAVRGRSPQGQIHHRLRPLRLRRRTSRRLDGDRHGLIDHWLEPIRDTARANAEALDALEDQSLRHDLLCELNVKAQVRRVAETPIVRDAWTSGQTLTISGWVYGLKDGLLRDLGCTRSGSGTT